MIGAIDRFPDHFLKPLEESDPSRIRTSKIQSVVLMGMGGSASAGDVTLDWLKDKIRIPSVVHREPGIPRFVNSRTLFIAISYSGETRETLLSFRAAKQRGSRLVGIGTGGTLSRLCKEFRSPFIHVSSTVAPRAALGQLIVASASTLANHNLVRQISGDMLRAGRDLSHLRNRIGKNVPVKRNPAKQLAFKLLGRIIAVYSLQRMSSVARRFKNQLAENSKTAAKFDVLPEACHNEIESWQRSGENLMPVIIRDRAESSFEGSVIEAFQQTIRSAIGSTPLEVRLSSRGRLSQLLTPIFFLDYVSAYLAILKDVDPTPTDQISRYKKRLGLDQTSG